MNNTIREAIDDRWKGGPLWAPARAIHWLFTYPVSIIAGIFLGLFALLVIFFLGALAQLIIIALLLLSFVPPVRGLITAIQEGLARNLGDGYLIASNPLNLNAMVSRVRHDIDWLRRNDCQRIAIIAHSGGASVSYESLTGHDAPHVHLLITYGQGLTKLQAMRHFLENRRFSYVFSPLLRVAAIAAFIAGLILGAQSEPQIGWTILLFFISIVFFSLGTLWSQVNIPEGRLIDRWPNCELWRDFYTAADPTQT